MVPIYHINEKVYSGNEGMKKGVLTGDPFYMVSCPPTVPGHQKKGGGRVVKAAFWQRRDPHKGLKTSLISPSWCHSFRVQQPGKNWNWAITINISIWGGYSRSLDRITGSQKRDLRNPHFFFFFSPWGLTLGFHENRNVKIWKADTVKGIRNGKLGLLWIVDKTTHPWPWWTKGQEVHSSA